MTVSDVAEAVRVLSAAQHRGARCWCWDPATLRVAPAGWSGRDEAAAPCFTAFEALAIARGLAQIGAVRALDGPWGPVGALP